MAQRKPTSPLHEAARPSADFPLTNEEKAMLADPEWITPDEADGILCMRRDKRGGEVEAETVLAGHGLSLED